jgi:hypothetical protein
MPKKIHARFGICFSTLQVNCQEHTHSKLADETQSSTLPVTVATRKTPSRGLKKRRGRLLIIRFGKGKNLVEVGVS